MNEKVKWNIKNCLFLYEEFTVKSLIGRDTDYGDYVPGEYFEFDYVELPFGTIKKLTGSELTYNDEPLKIGGNGEKC